jgi:hypothetical protein
MTQQLQMGTVWASSSACGPEGLLAKTGKRERCDGASHRRDRQGRTPMQSLFQTRAQLSDFATPRTGQYRAVHITRVPEQAHMNARLICECHSIRSEGKLLTWLATGALLSLPWKEVLNKHTNVHISSARRHMLRRRLSGNKLPRWFNALSIVNKGNAATRACTGANEECDERPSRRAHHQQAFHDLVSRCRHTIVGSEPVLKNKKCHSVPLPFGLKHMVDLPPTKHHPVRRHDNYWLFDTPLQAMLATMLTFVACCVEKELRATALPILRYPPRATSEMILGYQTLHPGVLFPIHDQGVLPGKCLSWSADF